MCGIFSLLNISDTNVLFTQELKPNLWLYDVKANEWTPIEPVGEQPPAGRLVGYYDPERDVLVHYNSKEVWVCRVKIHSLKRWAILVFLCFNLFNTMDCK